MKKVKFYTLGCKVNQYETEAMIKLFTDNGYEYTENSELANVSVINTCTVTSLSDRKSRQIIKKSKRDNPEGIIIVVGCYAQVAPEEVEKIKEVDIIIGTSEKDKIVELCNNQYIERERMSIVKPINEVKDFEDIKTDDNIKNTRIFLKIQDGCNMFCSYCIIPYARGNIRSRNLDNIVEEAKSLAKKGFKEIVLTGIHVASYGKDLKKKIDLLDVLERINTIEGIERIRLSSIEPKIITENFLDRYSKIEKACDHFHLSLQSGDDSILKRMNRKYTTNEFSKIVYNIRKILPNTGITTDVIVGFPGETNEEFKNTCNFVKNIGFSKVHVFKYSPREGTTAANMEDQIDGNIKNERSKALIEIETKLGEKFKEGQIDSILKVLVEETSKNSEDFVEGYSSNYIRVKTKGNIKDLKGKIVSVKILSIENSYMLGKII